MESEIFCQSNAFKASVDQLLPGVVIVEPAIDPDGKVILLAGTQLRREHINTLKSRQVVAVCISAKS